MAISIASIVMGGAGLVNAFTNGQNAINVVGQTDFVSSSFNTTSTTLNAPTSVEVDTVNHRLFVADAGNSRVLVFNLDNENNLVNETADYVLGQADLNSSDTALTINGLDLDQGGIIFDEVNNRLFVSDDNNYRVMVYDTTTITNGEDAIAVLGQDDFVTPDSDTTIDRFYYNESTPAYDPDRQLLFVPEYDNNRVMVFDVNSITNGEDAVYVIGQDDFESNETGTSPTRFDGLEYVGSVYDPTTRRLYVSDLDGNRVLVFDTTTITNGMAASYVLGQDDFTSNSYGNTIDTLYSPQALEIDTEGQRLYVYDMDNARIMVFDVQSITNGEDAVSVLGQPNFTSAGSSTTQSTIGGGVSTSMSYDKTTGNLYFADSDNNRIMVWQVGDSDFDGTSDADEERHPNNGDGNGDGTIDSAQANVSSISNSNVSDAGAYVTIEISGGDCTDLTTFNSVSEESKGNDAGYDYPVGLVDFSVECSSLGSTASVKVFYDKEYDTGSWVARKFVNGSFIEVPGAAFGTATVGSKVVTTLSYDVVDGGPLDADGVANGTVVDPAGPAALEVTAPDTGLGITQSNSYYIAIAVGIAILGFAARQTKRS